MAIILDVDVVIGGEKGTFDLGRWAASLLDEQFAIAAITVAELWHGVERASGSVRTRRERYLRTVLEPLPILPYSEQTAFEHARIWVALEVSGQMDRLLRPDRGCDRARTRQHGSDLKPTALRKRAGAENGRPVLNTYRPADFYGA